eukprot:2561414-Amphidinium_carterae.5
MVTTVAIIITTIINTPTGQALSPNAHVGNVRPVHVRLVLRGVVHDIGPRFLVFSIDGVDKLHHVPPHTANAPKPVLRRAGARAIPSKGTMLGDRLYFKT